MSPDLRAPLVLIHGFTGGPRWWDPVVPLLASQHEVHAVTLIGHCGGVLESPKALTVDAYADALERGLDDAGIETAHIVGNSLGGWLALMLAARGRARSVVCLAPAGGWEPGTMFERAIVAKFAAAGVAVHLLESRGDRLLRRPGIRRALLRELVAHPERVSQPAARAILEDAAGCTALVPMVTSPRRRRFDGAVSSDVPVRIAWSEFDRVLPKKRARARFAELVPQAEQIELPGVGHVPMSDDPELVARTILEVTGAAA
jgi:pimeloyl-ACP methyl ester carboxylesterase